MAPDPPEAGVPGSRGSENNNASNPSPSPSSPGREDAPRQRSRGSSGASGRLRSASVRLLESAPPLGMWQATGEVVAQAPTINDIRRGTYSHNGWSDDVQFERRQSFSADAAADPSLGLSQTRSRSSVKAASAGSKLSRTPTGGIDRRDTLPETVAEHEFPSGKAPRTTKTSSPLSPIATDEETVSKSTPSPSADGITLLPPREESPVSPLEDAPPTYANGYRDPPKHTWGEATVIGLKAFWSFTCTWFGFLIVLYGLNVVAWGGMLFLLLCNAAPAMCRPTCNDINSPRRIWIEIDSQILNALFCVTGFGLIPWRFRDLYFLLRWRLQKKHDALRRLAGINRGWFRLPGSDTLDPQSVFSEDETLVPLPLNRVPDTPPTGVRAPPTAPWKLDFVIWCYVMNTFLQAVLSGFMWGLNRYDRPSWSTGLFVALACIVAGIGGLMAFLEGKRVKKFEGVPEGRPDAAEQAEKQLQDRNPETDTEKQVGLAKLIL
ncbi:MAG: hypothetical protein M1825_006431 [Sarcosagium campestre]|nr:MAG: hypothetical protein M1825_006431 [Sarcosagium campestre]